MITHHHHHHHHHHHRRHHHHHQHIPEDHTNRVRPTKADLGVPGHVAGIGSALVVPNHASGGSRLRRTVRVQPQIIPFSVTNC